MHSNKDSKMNSLSCDINDDEQPAITEAVRILSTYGVVQPGSAGLDLNTLAAAVYAHGWGYGIDCVAGEFRAEILPLASSELASGVFRIGSTPEAALSLALAHALRVSK